MASLDSGSVLPPPLYNPHEFASPYHPCTSSIVNSLNSSGEGPSPSPRCGNPVKSVSSVSVASMGQTHSASPSYPTANSWPGFDGKNSMGLQNTGQPNEVKNVPLTPLDALQKRQRKNGVYVFTSKMANDAYECVQQSRFDSILAWHEANCRPSTSTADDSSPGRRELKRKSTDNIGRMPDTIDQTVANQSSKLTRSVSENGARLTSGEQGNVPVISSPSNLLVLNDGMDTNTSSDNPIRRMERMTRDSLFEPPAAKISRGASSENEQFIRKTTDEDNPDRELKLAKLKNIQQIVNGTRNRGVQPQCSQVHWDRMLQEQEAMKFPQGYSQQMVSGYPGQGVIGGPPPYQMPPHGMPPGMHPGFRRPAFMGQISPQVMSPIPPSNGPIMDVMGAPGMQMTQPMRSALNPPPYNIHVTPDGYMPYEYAPSAFTSQGYPMTMPSTASPAYSPMFSPMNGAPMPLRGYSIYTQGPRPMYPPDKMVPPEMWGQQLPQPLSNLEARIPNQKIQYHPNGAVIDENLGDNINNMNPLFG